VQVLLSAQDFDTPPRPLGRVELPTPFAPNRQSYQREVARLLERAKLGPRDPRRNGRAHDPALDDHPVLADPDLAGRLKAAATADRIERELADLVAKVRGRSRSLARRFDQVLEILAARGYVDGWSLTDRGARLARLFHECDLLVAETLHRGLLDDLDAPALAALVSVFVYEHRSSEPPPAPWFPSAEVRRRWQAIDKLGRQLNVAEDLAGLPLTRPPDATFGAVAFAWAAGEGFAEVVEAEELSGGDFVRTVKQLIDLLRQLAQLAPEPGTARTCEQAADLLFRGVIAASTAVESATEGAA
jgi:ATP-dependent RNA helicase HelY